MALADGKESVHHPRQRSNASAYQSQLAYRLPDSRQQPTWPLQPIAGTGVVTVEMTLKAPLKLCRNLYSCTGCM
jgi:hypothetical protein